MDDAALAGLIGASIGALAGLIGSFLSNWYLVRKEREQWSRDKELEYQRWLREKLQEIYSNCIFYLSNLLGKPTSFTASEEGIMIADKKEKWSDDYSQALKWLGLLLVYGSDLQGFKSFMENYSIFSQSAWMEMYPDIQVIQSLRDWIISVAVYDERLFPRGTKFKTK